MVYPANDAVPLSKIPPTSRNACEKCAVCAPNAPFPSHPSPHRNTCETCRKDKAMDDERVEKPERIPFPSEAFQLSFPFKVSVCPVDGRLADTIHPHSRNVVDQAHVQANRRLAACASSRLRTAPCKHCLMHVRVPDPRSSRRRGWAVPDRSNCRRR